VRPSVTSMRNRRQNGGYSFVYFSVYVFQVGEGNAKRYEVDSRKDSTVLLMNGSQTRGPPAYIMRPAATFVSHMCIKNVTQ
jgi:hypothetical protein